MVRKAVLNECLPSDGQEISTTASILKLEQLRRSLACTSAGPFLVGEVAGILAFVKKVANKEGISNEELLKFSDFFKQSVKSMGRSFVIKQRVCVAGGKFQSGTVWYGKDAIERHIADCHKRTDNGEALTLEDVQPLRTFSWFLAAEQVEKSKAWLATILRGVCAFRPIADKASAEAAGNGAGSTSSGSAASGGSSAALALLGVGGAAKKSKGDQNTTTKVDMLEFFSGKRKH